MQFTLLNLLFWALMPKSAESMMASLSVDPVFAGLDSSLQIFIFFDETIGASGKIKVSVPPVTYDSGVQLSVLNQPLSFKTSGFQCSTSNPNVSVVNCTSTSSNTLEITFGNGHFIMAGESLTITIKGGTKNPSSLLYKEKTLKVQTYNSQGQLVEEVSEYMYLASLQPAPIYSNQTSLVYASQVFGTSNSQITLAFKLTNPVPVRGKLELTFPWRVSGQQESELQFISPTYFSITSIKVDGVQKLSQYTTSLSTSQRNEKQVILIDSAGASNDLNGGQTVELTIGGFNNPIDYGSITQGLVIRTFDNFQHQIDQSNLLTLTVTQPALIQSSRVFIDSGSTLVNGVSGLRMDIRSPIPLSQGCIVLITVPVSLSNNIFSILRAIYASGAFGTIRAVQFDILTLSNGQKQVKISTLCDTLIMNNIDGTLNLKFLQNPDSIRDTENFQIQITDSLSRPLVQSDDSKGYMLRLNSTVFQPGTLTQFSLLPSNNTVREKNDLIVSIQLKNPLNISNRISFTLSIPQGFAIATTCNITTLTTNLVQNQFIVQNQGSVDFCLVNTSSRMATISNILASNIDQNSGFISFKITNLVTNPMTKLSQTGSFWLKTYKNLTQLVDQGEQVNPFPIEAGVLQGVTMTFIPDISSHPNPRINLKFLTQHDLVTGSEIRLSLKQDLRNLVLINQTLYQVSCQGQFIVPSSCKIIQDQSMIILSMLTSQTIPQNTAINLTFDNLVQYSPRFKGQFSDPILVHTLTSGMVVDEANYYYPIVSQTSIMKTCGLQLSSKTNLANSKLLINASLELTSVYLDDYLQLTIPDQLLSLIMPDPTQVSCEDPTLNCQLIKSNIGGMYLKIQGFQSKNLSNISLLGFKNPPSTKPFGPFELKAFDRLQRQINRCDYVNWLDGFYLQTQQANNITSVRLIQTSTVPNVTSNFTLMVEKNYLQSDIVPWVKLTLPDCVGVESGKQMVIYDLQSNSNIAFAQFSQFDYVFQLRIGVNFLTLINLINPTEACLFGASRLSFQYKSFEDQQLKYSMEQRLDGLEPSLSCKYPCQTCSLIDKSFCTSCQDPTNQLLLKSSGKCIQDIKCPPGLYLANPQVGVNQKECWSCPQNCELCQDFSGFCTKCVQDYASDSVWLLNQTSGTCIPYSDCNANKSLIVMDGTSCQKCSSDCAQCGVATVPVGSKYSKQRQSTTYSPTYCTRCNQPLWFVQNGQCVQSCDDTKTPVQETVTPYIATVLSGHPMRLKFYRFCFSPEDISFGGRALQAIKTFSEKTISKEADSGLIWHFPVLIFFFLPLIVIQLWGQTGERSLTLKEIVMMTARMCEQIGFFSLFVKLCQVLVMNRRRKEDIVAFDRSLSADQRILDGKEATDNDSFQISASLLLFFSILFILIQCWANETLYRKVVRIWEDRMQDGFVDTFHDDSRFKAATRFMMRIPNFMRFVNFQEFVTFWKYQGWAIDKKEVNFGIQFEFGFYEVSKRVVIFNLICKNSLLVFFICYFWFGLNTISFFGFSNSDQDGMLKMSQHSEYNEFRQFVDDLAQFVVNQMMEIMFLSLVANCLLMRYVATRDLLQITWPNTDQSIDYLEEAQPETKSQIDCSPEERKFPQSPLFNQGPQLYENENISSEGSKGKSLGESKSRGRNLDVIAEQEEQPELNDSMRSHLDHHNNSMRPLNSNEQLFDLNKVVSLSSNSPYSKGVSQKTVEKMLLRNPNLEPLHYVCTCGDYNLDPDQKCNCKEGEGIPVENEVMKGVVKNLQSRRELFWFKEVSKAMSQGLQLNEKVLWRVYSKSRREKDFQMLFQPDEVFPNQLRRTGLLDYAIAKRQRDIPLEIQRLGFIKDFLLTKGVSKTQEMIRDEASPKDSIDSKNGAETEREKDPVQAEGQIWQAVTSAKNNQKEGKKTQNRSFTCGDTEHSLGGVRPLNKSVLSCQVGLNPEE